jgi:hypothetical protein
VRRAAGSDEDAKTDKHPTERKISPSAHKIDQGQGDQEIGEGNQDVRHRMEPNESWLPLIAKTVRQQIMGRE